MKTLNLKTKLVAFLMTLFSLNTFAQAGYGEIRGTIKNTDGEVVPFATVKILQGTVLMGGTQSDVEGNYKYKPLTPGNYDMVIMEPGHQTQPINKIKVIPNQPTYVDPVITPNTLATVTVVAKPIEYVAKGVDKSMYVMKSIDSKDLLQSASYERGNVAEIISVSTSDAIKDANGVTHVRGARGDATSYYVDGVRTLGPNTIPGLAIENITFFTGGVPAMYGDMTSGAVIITTKSYFSGLREKNMRVQEYMEKQEAKKAAQKEKEEAERRKKELEGETISQ